MIHVFHRWSKWEYAGCRIGLGPSDERTTRDYQRRTCSVCGKIVQRIIGVHMTKGVAS